MYDAHNVLRMKSSGEHNTDHLIYNFLRFFLLITPLILNRWICALPSKVGTEQMTICTQYIRLDHLEDLHGNKMNVLHITYHEWLG